MKNGRDRAAAEEWYHYTPLSGFGGRTAEQLVDEAKGQAAVDYLDEVALGGFA
ncbi:antitoxin Xre/MbcA/ParS toxin-binding domain-containing protein [Tranquillimonas alkanivorans]|uniref:Antitoxin Xre/MbcA/ParS-like toxin-binding domain-containing protein n=1 Tax=Tranquillimonas alkanivorans TaxID=441119 RepID=A0A1I5WPG6_9RHOB|nr:antitoxin Xre/MbcA/ParS toxin-binding domain-containing protein [Tranquillimonas alkanivorans]SFQ21600.1 Protein of unknown function [Tranquillimonas alkanivorans]